MRIHREMREEARSIAREVIDTKTVQINSELHGIKQDIQTLKQDIQTLKQDIQNIKRDVSELTRNVVDLHKQNTNSTRLLLLGMFGVGGSSVGLNQYIENKRESIKNEAAARVC